MEIVFLIFLVFLFGLGQYITHLNNKSLIKKLSFGPCIPEEILKERNRLERETLYYKIVKNWHYVSPPALEINPRKVSRKRNADLKIKLV
jgi:hypothetical protein